MLSHRLLIGVIGIAVLWAGYFLLPRAEEHVTMLARDGLYEAASKELSALEDSGANRPDLLIQTHLLREKLGDHVGALNALTAFLAIRPNDFAAREKQAELFLQSGEIDHHLAAMAKLASIRPSVERLSWLLELYRLHGRFDDELALMQLFAESGYLEHTQLERMGAMLAGRGDWAGAIKALHLVDQRAPNEASSGRLLLFDVLLQSDHVDEAAERAHAWMVRWRDSYLSAKLIIRMAQTKFDMRASDLARACVEEMPEATFNIAGVLTRKGHADVSRQMLTRWAELERNPTSQQLRDYVYASAQAGDAQGPLLKMAEFARHNADPGIQAQLAEELADAYGPSVLASLRPMLLKEVLLTRPLFAAELANSEGNPQLASWYLAQTNLSLLTPEERLAWLQLLQQVETKTVVFERLVQMWNEKKLPPELLRAFAEEAQQRGHPQLHDAIWQSIAN